MCCTFHNEYIAYELDNRASSISTADMDGSGAGLIVPLLTKWTAIAIRRFIIHDGCC